MDDDSLTTLIFIHWVRNGGSWVWMLQIHFAVLFFLLSIADLKNITLLPLLTPTLLHINLLHIKKTSRGWMTFMCWRCLKLRTITSRDSSYSKFVQSLLRVRVRVGIQCSFLEQSQQCLRSVCSNVTVEFLGGYYSLWCSWDAAHDAVKRLGRGVRRRWSGRVCAMCWRGFLRRLMLRDDACFCAPCWMQLARMVILSPFCESSCRRSLFPFSVPLSCRNHYMSKSVSLGSE